MTNDSTSDGPGAGAVRVSRGGGADRGEDPGADDRADAQQDDVPGAEGAPEVTLPALGIADQDVQRLGAEEPGTEPRHARILLGMRVP